MTDFLKVFTFSASAWIIHTQANRTIVLTDDFADDHAELAEEHGDGSDNLESWSGEVVSVDPIHTAISPGDLAYSAGHGCDVAIYRAGESVEDLGDGFYEAADGTTIYSP